MVASGPSGSDTHALSADGGAHQIGENQDVLCGGFRFGEAWESLFMVADGWPSGLQAPPESTLL